MKLCSAETGVKGEKNSSLDGGGPGPHDRKAKPVPGVVPLHHPLQAGEACAELGTGQRRTHWNDGAGGCLPQCVLTSDSFRGLLSLSGALTENLACFSGALSPALSSLFLVVVFFFPF